MRQAEKKLEEDGRRDKEAMYPCAEAEELLARLCADLSVQAARRRAALSQDAARSIAATVIFKNPGVPFDKLSSKTQNAFRTSARQQIRFISRYQEIQDHMPSGWHGSDPGAGSSLESILQTTDRPRRRVALYLLAFGLTQSEIAGVLGCSQATVSREISTFMQIAA